jgi:hypothetical protein
MGKPNPAIKIESNGSIPAHVCLSVAPDENFRIIDASDVLSENPNLQPTMFEIRLTAVLLKRLLV